jgi:hypothetical protein
MRLLQLLNASVCLVSFCATFVQASEPAKIERPPTKEPVYKSNSPKYALLLFGPKGETRTWLVLDGTTLYVDRNGNGDLTEEGETVLGKKSDGESQGEPVYTFAVGELRDGERRHRNVTLIVSGFTTAPETKTAASSDARSVSYRIRMEAEIPGFAGVTKDGGVLQMAAGSGGSLQFADRPREAPILHFAGPLSLVVSGQQEFRVNREMELYLTLGTQGRGQGTFVYTAYEGAVPPAAYARAEIAFPAQKPGEPPVKAIYELKGRC